MKTFDEIIQLLESYTEIIGVTSKDDLGYKFKSAEGFKEQAINNGYNKIPVKLFYLHLKQIRNTSHHEVLPQHFNAEGNPITSEEYFKLIPLVSSKDQMI